MSSTGATADDFDRQFGIGRAGDAPRQLIGNVEALCGRELQHGGNPIATWCASNVSVRKDPVGNEKPDKERSTEKIDAIVAAVMAVGRMQAGGQGAP